MAPYGEERERNICKRLQDVWTTIDRSASALSSAWDDIATYCRPISRRDGAVTLPEVYDSTSIQALESFASGLHSQLTSPAERWFSLSIAGKKDTKYSKEEETWLDETSDMLYYALSLPTANFNSAMSEFYAELGAFGTACLYQEEDARGVAFRFRCLPISQIRIREDAKEKVDTVFRKFPMTARQLRQSWPDVAEHPRFKGKRDDADMEVVHAVYPLNAEECAALGMPPEWFAQRGFAYASVHYVPGSDILLSVGGFVTLPYHVCRWSKLAGQLYGRSPGMNALPDIKMVNAMSREMILSAEHANRPPLVVDDDSLLTPLTAVRPGSVMYVNPGSRLPTPLMSGAQPMLADKEMERRRMMIDAAFYTDLFIRGKKKERQSVLEIQDDRSELTRQLLPMFGRIQCELLTPVISRSLDILVRQQKVRRPPAQYGGWNPLDVVYTNSATKAQLHGKAFAISQLFADLAPLAQVDPNVLRVIDMRAAAMSLAIARDIDPEIIRSQEDIDAEIQQQAQAQQQQAAMQNANLAGQTMKNIASARATDPGLLR